MSQRKKRPLIKKPDAPDAPPETLRVYDKPALSHYWRDELWGTMQGLDIWPRITVVREMIETGERHIKDYSYYITKTGLYRFRVSPYSYNGMLEATFGQFNYYRGDGQADFAEMVLDPMKMNKSMAHFNKCVARIRRRKARRQNG
jgi:hypothetical protein